MKLLVDRVTSKVLFAETDEAFVDVLFSFLTLPIGVVCRLRRRRGNTTAPTALGCMDNLYGSLMKLDPKYFRNAELKLILSAPRRSFQPRYWSLVRNVPATARRYCLCGSRISSQMKKSVKICSDNRLAFCMCGIPNNCRCDSCPRADDGEDNRDGLLFLRAGGRADQFVVTDEFKVAPLHRAASVLSALRGMGVRLANNIEEVSVPAHDRDKVVSLLMRSLVSSSPMSDVFCPARQDKASETDSNEPGKAGERSGTALTIKTIAKPRKYMERTKSDSSSKESGDDAQGEIMEEENGRHPKPPRPNDEAAFRKSKEAPITIKLIVDAACGRVLFAEAGEDFVDLLFNFLTYPLGSLALLSDDGTHPIPCFGNLWGSLNDMDADKHIKSERCKQMLLYPELPHEFCGGLLVAEDSRERSGRSLSRQSSTSSKALLFLAPSSSKSSSVARESSVKDGVLKDCSVFMVTDELIVTPLSSMSVISMLHELKCQPEHVREFEAIVNVEKARELLLAALISTTALSSVFLPDGHEERNKVDSTE